MAEPKGKKGETKESKLIYMPFVALVAVAVLIFVLPQFSSSHNVSASNQGPYFQIYKVSNQDYAPPGKAEVYFVSWIGCPNGAADS